MTKALVVMVCRGNIGRSPFAEAILKQEIARRSLNDRIQVVSRGVQGTSVDPEPVKHPNITYYKELYKDSKPTLDRLGVDMSKHSSTSISKNDAEHASILLAMDHKTQNALKVLFPAQAYKIHLISELVGDSRDITDPEGVSGSDRQERIFTELNEILHSGFSHLLELLNLK